MKMNDSKMPPVLSAKPQRGLKWTVSSGFGLKTDTFGSVGSRSVSPLIFCFDINFSKVLVANEWLLLSTVAAASNLLQ